MPIAPPRRARSRRAAPLRVALALAAAIAGAPARADVAEVVARQIGPGFAAFAAAAAALEAAAAADCRPEALKAPWNAAFDAWLGVQHLHLGPSEENGRALAIAYWPDPKQVGARQLKAMRAAADPAVATPGGIAGASVAARGLFGLERLLYGAPYAAQSYDCRLVQAMAGDLAATARDLAAGWAEHGAALTSAGRPGNTLYLSATEARQALFTQLMAGLDFVEEARLGRPMGSFEAPRPERAEAVASGRSQRNVVLSLTALAALARDLAPAPAPLTEAALGRAIAQAAALPDPALAAVASPGGRLKVEIVQQSIIAAKAAAQTEIGAPFGITAGFNSADGD